MSDVKRCWITENEWLAAQGASSIREFAEMLDAEGMLDTLGVNTIDEAETVLNESEVIAYRVPVAWLSVENWSADPAVMEIDGNPGRGYVRVLAVWAP